MLLMLYWTFIGLAIVFAMMAWLEIYQIGDDD